MSDIETPVWKEPLIEDVPVELSGHVVVDVALSVPVNRNVPPGKPAVAAPFQLAEVEQWCREHIPDFEELTDPPQVTSITVQAKVAVGIDENEGCRSDAYAEKLARDKIHKMALPKKSGYLNTNVPYVIEVEVEEVHVTG